MVHVLLAFSIPGVRSVDNIILLLNASVDCRA
jgi:hypothetical protein